MHTDAEDSGPTSACFDDGPTVLDCERAHPSLAPDDVTKPYEFIGFGAMDVTKPYTFIRLGAMDVTKQYKFIGFDGFRSDAHPRRPK